MKRRTCIQILCLIVCLCCVSCYLDLPDGSACVSQDLNGTCVSIYRCSSDAHSYIFKKAGYDPKYLPEIEICSYKNDTPIVCCTDCKIQDTEYYRNTVLTAGGILYHKKGHKAFVKCLEYFETAPYRCHGKGDFTLSRELDETEQCHKFAVEVPYTIGGRSAHRWEFPHMALLGYGDDQLSAQWLCGGSVISEKFILTAGHCVYSTVLGNVTFAALGILKRSDPLEYWNVFKIKRAITHPEYKPPSKYHDIALLELDTDLTFSEGILPACVDVEDDRLDKFAAEASGWGQLGHRNRLADTLQTIRLYEYNETDCASEYPKHRHLKQGYDHTTQMCYGSYLNISDTCQGDSGGPLQVDEERCQYTVIGVTSFGKNCGTLGSPGIYTRVSYYEPWISSIVWPE